MIHVDTVAELARSMSVKREKKPDDSEVVVCSIKVSQAFITRDQLDEFCGRPIGWHSFLFDEQGAPVARLELGLPGAEWTVVGTVRGSNDTSPGLPALNLLEAKLSGVQIGLTTLGANLSGALSWTARGDEVEDLTEILGTLVKIVWRVNDGGQLDLLKNGMAATVVGAIREAIDDVRNAGRTISNPGDATTLGKPVAAGKIGKRPRGVQQKRRARA